MKHLYVLLAIVASIMTGCIIVPDRGGYYGPYYYHDGYYQHHHGWRGRDYDDR